MSIDALQQLHHSIRPSIFSSLGLLHVDVFLEVGCFDFNQVDMHSTMSCQCQACAQSAEFDYERREGGRVVYSWALAEILSYQSGLELTDGAICVGLDFEDPLVACGVSATMEFGRSECSVVRKGVQVTGDGFAPNKGAILAGRGLAAAFHDRKMWLPGCIFSVMVRHVVSCPWTPIWMGKMEFWVAPRMWGLLWPPLLQSPGMSKEENILA